MSQSVSPSDRGKHSLNSLISSHILPIPIPHLLFRLQLICPFLVLSLSRVGFLFAPSVAVAAGWLRYTHMSFLLGGSTRLDSLRLIADSCWLSSTVLLCRWGIFLQKNEIKMLQQQRRVTTRWPLFLLDAPIVECMRLLFLYMLTTYYFGLMLFSHTLYLPLTSFRRCGWVWWWVMSDSWLFLRI